MNDGLEGYLKKQSWFILGTIPALAWRDPWSEYVVFGLVFEARTFRIQSRSAKYSTAMFGYV
jgi:hypothetical protein